MHTQHPEAKINIDAKWFLIPGFSSYEINIRTREVRSNKHFNKMRFHIMQVNGGKVRIVDDFGKPTSISVDELYSITFNQGNKLRSRGDNDYHMGGMRKINRNMQVNCDLLNHTYTPVPPEEPKTFSLDFSSGMPTVIPTKTKPFNINTWQT